MVRVRVKVHPPDEQTAGYHVHLPSWVMIPNTEQYADPKKTQLSSIEVEIPDDECTDGKPDKAKIRAKYRGQPAWDRDDVLSDV